MYTILTDSCSDLNAEVAAKFDHFEVIPLSYTISGETSFQPFDDAQRCSAFYDRRMPPHAWRGTLCTRITPTR